RRIHRALPFRKKKPLAQLFPGANPLALDLMEKCLTFSPKRRIDVEAALAHPYLEPYHDPQDEPTAPARPVFLRFRQRQGAEEGTSQRCVMVLLCSVSFPRASVRFFYFLFPLRVLEEQSSAPA
ncbi:hypothetical protein BKA62DRAFT_625909, partial [Auriculariales sp. MPI-PUGE-AT-0066]